MSPNAEFLHPGVYLEETPANVKVIPGVATSTGDVAQKWHPSVLVGSGYTIIETKIESGGLALLLAKGEDRVLVRMSDVRDGSSVEGQLVVTFAAKVP